MSTERPEPAEPTPEKKHNLLFVKGRHVLAASLISLIFTVLNPTGYSSLALIVFFSSQSEVNTETEYRSITRGTLISVKKHQRIILLPFAFTVLIYNIYRLIDMLRCIGLYSDKIKWSKWSSIGVIMAFVGFALFFFSELPLLDILKKYDAIALPGNCR